MLNIVFRDKNILQRSAPFSWDIFFWGFSKEVIIGPGNGMVLIRQHSITWTSDDQDLFDCITYMCMVSQSHNEHMNN